MKSHTNLNPIGSAVLTFIGYKQTDTQTSKVYLYIHVWKQQYSITTAEGINQLLPKALSPTKNSDFENPTLFHPCVVDLWYFKLWIVLDRSNNLCLTN